MDEITSAILAYIKTQYLEERQEQVDCDTPLISSGLVDSFALVTLLRFLENKYRIGIPDREATAEAFDSAAKIAALVQRHLPTTPSP